MKPKLSDNRSAFYWMVGGLIAAFLLAPFLVAIAAFISTIAGMIIANITIGLESSLFLDSVWKAISLKEYFYPLLKTEIFSIYAVLINVSLGLGCEGGALDVPGTGVPALDDGGEGTGTTGLEAGGDGGADEAPQDSP